MSTVINRKRWYSPRKLDRSVHGERSMVDWKGCAEKVSFEFTLKEWRSDGWRKCRRECV